MFRAEMMIMPPILRILDANLNRLREALRVIEEYYRFIREDEGVSVSLKGMRHKLIGIEKSIGQENLLTNRDTENDCFASETRPEELNRPDIADVLTANFKRAQEACRVIEEYSKTAELGDVSRDAKVIRFALYELQASRPVSPAAAVK